MFKIFKNLFGTKYDRDVKLYSPIVEEVNHFFDSYSDLSNDELRNKSLEFKKRIAEHLEGIDKDIEALNTEAANEADLNRKEELFNQIDELKKDRDKHLEEILKIILPEAFAVVKETARRFSHNTEIPVSITDHDKEIAAYNDYVNIQGDKTE